MFTIQKRRFHRRDEKLRPIRIRARIRHAQYPGGVMFEQEILVGEGFRAVDGCAACAVAVEEVPALDHEVFDYAVEF